MKAIVLTYDKYHPIADHMIQCYMTLWPSNPFIFVVPYQKYPDYLKEKYGDKVQLIETDKGIKSTVLTLLSNIDDNEWVFWCMDDHYPTQLDVDEISSIHKWVGDINDAAISGILYTYETSDWQFKQNNIMSKKNKIVDSANRDYYRIRNFKMIWFHQYLRAKVLKHFFGCLPDNLAIAKDMDYYKDNIELPVNYRRYICSQRYSVIGESANRGKLTLNCSNSMRNLGIERPSSLEILDKEIFRCSKKYERSSLYYYSRNLYYYIRNKIANN